MQITTDNITHLAARAASILMQWAGLNQVRKNNNGDQGPLGGMFMALSMLAQEDPGPPPSDAEGKMLAYIEGQLRGQVEQQRLYYVLDVDYGPGPELVELSEACGLKCLWPIKSSLSIRAYGDDPGSVIHRETTYALVPERGGWLVTMGFCVDTRIRTIVVDAVTAGSTVAGFEPFQITP